MGRVVAISSGVLVLAILAGGLTEAALAMGHRGRIVDDTLLRPAGLLTGKMQQPTPAASKAPAPTPSSMPTPSVTPTFAPTPTPTPVATPSPTPSGPVATTNAFVHMRGGMSVYSPILQDLNAGTVVRILPGGDTQWQKAEYNGVIGFVFKQWLTY